jgi:hypothetical protein
MPNPPIAAAAPSALGSLPTFGPHSPVLALVAVGYAAMGAAVLTKTLTPFRSSGSSTTCCSASPAEGAANTLAPFAGDAPCSCVMCAAMVALVFLQACPTSIATDLERHASPTTTSAITSSTASAAPDVSRDAPGDLVVRLTDDVNTSGACSSFGDRAAQDAVRLRLGAY